jgi:transposase
MNAATIPLEQHLSEIAKLTQEVSRLQEQLAWFQKQIFGQRSERIIAKDEHQQEFDLQIPSAPVLESELKKISSYDRRVILKGKDKISFPENLPIQTTVIDLKPEEKICAVTGKELVKIGEDITQKLAHKPGSYYIKQTIRPKYAMPKGAPEGIRTAELPESILPRCKADNSLLADILVKKFADHLPLYRQSEILSREGIVIPRQVLSQWVVKCGLALKPLYTELLKQVLDSKNIFIDEVPVSMLQPGKGSVQQTYMWVIVGGKESNPASRVYNFRTDRRHVNAVELLKSYQDGVVHSDKYGAYEALASRKTFIWCPCWAHIRRRFFEAESGDQKFTEYIQRKMKYLFMYERVAWHRSAEERLRIRQEKEVPIIDDIIRLVQDRLYNGQFLARSKFREALGYFMGLVPYIKNYTKDAYARMDNNVAERAVRPLVIGRKNWLFLGSEEGGEAAATILSLVQTCRALNINPRMYLEDVLNRLPDHNYKKLHELLPNNWFKPQ